MKVRTAFCVFAMTAFVMAGTASATTIYDDFNDVSGTPAPGLWTVSSNGGAAIEANSYLTTTGVTMSSTALWNTANTTFEFKLGDVAPDAGFLNQGNVFGIAGGGGAVLVQSQWGNGNWYFGIVNAGTLLINPPLPGQIYDFTLTPGGAHLHSDQALQDGVYDLDVTGNVTGPLGFSIINWGGRTATFDHVATSTIPEPCSLTLLVLGLLGLLAYAWRRQK